MSAILLIFVVSFALVSGDVAGDQHLLERIEMLEQKLSTLYEMMLEDRHVKNDCNCSYLEEDIRDIGIIAAKNRHNILVNSDMIEVNVNSIIDMEEKVESNTGNLEVRIYSKINLPNTYIKYYICKHLPFVIPDAKHKGDF